jgi:hypothetical protein
VQKVRTLYVIVLASWHLQKKVAILHVCLDSVSVIEGSSILDDECSWIRMPNALARYLTTPNI